MTEEEFKKLPQSFAVEILGSIESLPHSIRSNIVARQLAKCSTSVGANYRAACRARSKAEMISKLRIVEEECDESLYWTVDTGYWLTPEIDRLKAPAEDILKMTVASIRTLRSRRT